MRTRSGRARQEKQFEGAITFDPPLDRDQNFTGVFGSPFFHLVDVESILGEEEVSSCLA